MAFRLVSLILSLSLFCQQAGIAYASGELNLANYLSSMRNAVVQPDVFQPPRLRYISYDIKSNDFKLLLDKGDPKLSNSPNSQTPKLTPATQELFNYFLIGLALPNDTFWVNLRPDAPENIIDPLLEKTDIGKIFLEADLQLKKDTASLTSPQNPEGKQYWDKLYKKAGELFGTENITIPTITRPWIVPNEVIVRETEDSAYIYKATLKVMLEEDYLQNPKTEKPKNRKTEGYGFSDPRLKELNEYSTQLIRETIIPRLTREVNSSKRYAKLRQVYYSLVLARWFKQKYSSPGSIRASERQRADASANSYLSLIDSGNLVNLVSPEPCDKQTYFQVYQKSFKDGEYNLKETVTSPSGQSIRSYISGGVGMNVVKLPVNKIYVGISSEKVTGALISSGSPVINDVRADLREIYNNYSGVKAAIKIIELFTGGDEKGKNYIKYLEDTESSLSVFERVKDLHKSLLMAFEIFKEANEHKQRDEKGELTQTIFVKLNEKRFLAEFAELQEKMDRLKENPYRLPWIKEILGQIDLFLDEFNDVKDPGTARRLREIKIEIGNSTHYIDVNKKWKEGVREFLISKTRQRTGNRRKVIEDAVKKIDEIIEVHQKDGDIESGKTSGSPLTWREKIILNAALLVLKNVDMRDLKVDRDKSPTLRDYVNNHDVDGLRNFIVKVANDTRGKDISQETGRDLLELWRDYFLKIIKDIDNLPMEASAYEIVCKVIKPDMELKYGAKRIHIKAVVNKFKRFLLRDDKENDGIDIDSMDFMRLANAWKDFNDAKGGSMASGSPITPLTVEDMRKIKIELKEYAETLAGFYNRLSSVDLTNGVEQRRFGKDYKNYSRDLAGTLNPQELMDGARTAVRLTNDKRPPGYTVKKWQKILVNLEWIENRIDLTLKKYAAELSELFGDKEEALYKYFSYMEKGELASYRQKYGQPDGLKNIDTAIGAAKAAVLLYKKGNGNGSIDVREKWEKVAAVLGEIDSISGQWLGNKRKVQSSLSVLRFSIEEWYGGLPEDTKNKWLSDVRQEMGNIALPRSLNIQKDISKYDPVKSVLIAIDRYAGELGVINSQAALNAFVKERAMVYMLSEIDVYLRRFQEGGGIELLPTYDKEITKKLNDALAVFRKEMISILGYDSVSSAVARGGIDLTDRFMSLKIERTGGFADLKLFLPQVRNAHGLDLDKEFRQIEAIASSGIVPNSRRILELFSACYSRGEFGQRLPQVISCLKASSAIQEKLAIDSDDDFRLCLLLPEIFSDGG